MRPWLYRLMVVISAWALRRGVSPAELMDGYAKAWPQRDGAWRLGLVEDAQARNQARMASQ